MRKVYFFVLANFFLFVNLFSASFTPGNLVLVRFGNGIGTITSASSLVFLDEYTTNGVFVQTISMPTSINGLNKRFVNSGSATSEGAISLSLNGMYLTLCGYDTTSGVAGVSTTGGIARVVGLVDYNGIINTTTFFTDGYIGSNIRSGCKMDGTAFWLGGNATTGSYGGVRYIPFGTSIHTQLSSTATNIRVVNIYNGQLYATTGSSGFYGINKVGTAIPTTTGQTTVNFFGLTSGTGNPSPYGFAFSPDGITCYVADDRALASGGGIQKWTYNGSSWALVYTLSSGVGTEGARSISVDFTGSNPAIYATSTTASANRLVKIVDAGSSSTGQVLLTAAANTVFRGLAFAPVSSNSISKSGFTSVLTPQYMASGDTSRLPVVFRASVTSLLPNTSYRYYVQGILSSEIGTNVSGSGNSILISANGTTYTYSSSPNLNSAGNFGTFSTDGSGNYTGWFSIVNTGNLRFTPGYYVLPVITIDNAGNGIAAFHYALNDSIKVLQFSGVSGVNNGTGIYGLSYASPKNIVALFDNTSGTGKPLTMTYTEDEGTTIGGIVRFYSDSVNAFAGRWGAIIPNINSNGVRLIQLYASADGSVLNSSFSADGNWPNGGSTINPVGGLSVPLRIDITDAPLPVTMASFTGASMKNSVTLSWQTNSELNNKGFEVERAAIISNSSSSWIQLGFVNGHGTTNKGQSYSFIDKNLNSGTYKYRLKQIDYNGNFEYFELAAPLAIGKPGEYTILQNYPNPFNPSTLISFSLPQSAKVQIKVFDIIGKEIRMLIDGDVTEGYHNISFNGSNLASGIYFYRISAKSEDGKLLYSKVMKMLLIK